MGTALTSLVAHGLNLVPSVALHLPGSAAGGPAGDADLAMTQLPDDLSTWMADPVPLPDGATSSPTRRTVTFLPVESGQPMCTVDIRRSAASCVALDAALVPVLAGVETSVVDPDAPVLIVSTSTLALVARNGSTLASRNLVTLSFRNLTQFGSAWHVDFNVSAAEATVYHHNATALFADIVDVDLGDSATFSRETRVRRLHYFTSVKSRLQNIVKPPHVVRPVPSQLLVTIPCLAESSSGGITHGSSFLLRSAAAALDSENRAEDCVYTIPDRPGSCPTGCRAELCIADFPVVATDGNVAARQCANEGQVVSSGRWVGNGNYDSYLGSTRVPSSPFLDASQRPGCFPYPIVAGHSPSQLFDGRRECTDGSAMIIDVYETYRLTTDFNRRAPLLPDAEHGLGKIFAIVPLTCGSSQVLVLRRQTSGVVNAAVVDFVPPPSPSGQWASSLVSNSVSLFIVRAPFSPSVPPQVAVTHSVGYTLVDLRTAASDTLLETTSIGKDMVWNPIDDVMLAVTASGKAFLDGELLISPAVPDVVAAALFLPPLRTFILVGSVGTSSHRISVLLTGAVSCNAVPSITTILEWVWLPSLSGSRDGHADLLILGGNATLGQPNSAFFPSMAPWTPASSVRWTPASPSSSLLPVSRCPSRPSSHRGSRA